MTSAGKRKPRHGLDDVMPDRLPRLTRGRQADNALCRGAIHDAGNIALVRDNALPRSPATSGDLTSWVRSLRIQNAQGHNGMTSRISPDATCMFDLGGVIMRHDNL